MRFVFRMSAAAPGARAPRAIVAALAILAGGALSGCGQRGALYMPVVPPLPAKPNQQTQPPSPEDVRPGAETASGETPASPGVVGTVPDTSGNALSLSPDSELRTTPNPATTPPTAPPPSAASTDQ